jgi:hypothetical protein
MAPPNQLKEASVNKPSTLRCRVCHDVIGEPYISLDRRTQKYGTRLWQGQPQGTVTVLECQEMFRYDSQDCRAVHEPQIVAELKLKTTHPDGGQVTPCSRCTAPVDRNLPHVSYIYLEGILTGENMTVTDSIELAVLCRECEEPDEPATQTAAADIDQPERSRA